MRTFSSSIRIPSLSILNISSQVPLQGVEKSGFHFMQMLHVFVQAIGSIFIFLGKDFMGLFE